MSSAPEKRDPRYLFVYGTLRSAFRNPYAQYLRDHAKLVGQACVRGCLYNLGRYPGLRPPRTPDDWVTGELYRLAEATTVLPLLDRYEGPCFRRVVRVVWRKGGPRMEVWVYEYLRPVAEMRRVVSGDFLKRGSGAGLYS